jgi:hypothetical protein
VWECAYFIRKICEKHLITFNELGRE